MRLPIEVLLKVIASKVPQRKYIFTENDVWLHSDSDYSQSLGIVRSAEASISMSWSHQVSLIQLY